MNGHPWSDPELAMIERLAGEIPFPELVASMQAQAERQGWPARTRKAYHCKLAKLGLRGRARIGRTLTTGGVAEALGISTDLVVKWLSGRRVCEVLKPHRIGYIKYTTRADWRRLARVIPEVLGGFSADALENLLQDRALAEQVSISHPRRPMDCHGIRCVETGQVWPNKTAAGRELFVSRKAIGAAIREDRPVTALGLRFEPLHPRRGNLNHGPTADGSADA